MATAIDPVTFPDISYLASPVDRSTLAWENPNSLIDMSGHRFPVVRGIPRFVSSDNYASSFGLQWNQFDKTQIDRFNGTTLSKERLFRSSQWDEDELKGKKVLEVGSGAGRFTQVLLDAGAEVYSVDYSNAVEANLRNNGPHPHLHLFQADIYSLPFQYEYFDRILCFGVLQHLPDVRSGFMSLIPFLKKNGEIAIDVYAKTWKTYLWSKYWYRPITRRCDHRKLLAALKVIVPLWFPISSLMLKIPGKVGTYLSQLLPIANYSRDFPEIARDHLVEWAIMDTFDMLAPRYDRPQSLKTLRRWMEAAGLDVMYCGPGDNGYVGVGKKCA